jgi:hypothetical protein
MDTEDLLRLLKEHEVDFVRIWNNKVKANFGKTPVYFASLDGLIDMKKASGRPQDLQNLKYLIALRERRRPE